MKKTLFFSVAAIILLFCGYGWTCEAVISGANLSVDSTEFGLRTFTFIAPEFNFNAGAIEKNCEIYVDKNPSGMMTETGANTGIFTINLKTSVGLHAFKVICTDPSTGETESAGPMSWSFGTIKWVPLPSACLQAGETWYLGGGVNFTVKADSAPVKGATSAKIVFPDDKEATIGVGQTYVYFPSHYGVTEEIFKVKLASVNWSAVKPCFQFSETYISSNALGAEVAPELVSIWGDSITAKKTLTAGESVDLSGGFNIGAVSIDSESNKATLVLKKDCVKLDQKIVAEGEYYTYQDILKVEAMAIFPGAVEGMVQLKSPKFKFPYNTASFPYKTCACVENWSCTSWSDCIDSGVQKRTCTDVNMCGTTVSKPSLWQNCSNDCAENWICGAWSVCSGGKQTRECVDANNCGTAVNKPSTSQNCGCEENWACSNWSACSGGKQTRSCHDANNCGTVVNKPGLEQECGAVCSEKWTCADWSACTNGLQLRRCVDSNKCGTTAQKPVVSQNCTCSENWSCSGWSVCANNEQSRNCIDLNGCGATNNKPVLKQSCSASIQRSVSGSQASGGSPEQPSGDSTGRGQGGTAEQVSGRGTQTEQTAGQNVSGGASPYVVGGLSVAGLIALVAIIYKLQFLIIRK